MTEKVKIKKLTIELEDEEIALTINQARKLQAALNDLFGVEQKDNQVIIWREHVPYWTYPADSVGWATGGTNADNTESTIDVMFEQSTGDLRVGID